MSLKTMFGLATLGLVASAGLAVPLAGDAGAAPYGCFKVTASHLNIRARPYSSSDVIGVASRGEILEKRYLFCTPRGFWCAVRKGSLEGYADKANMRKVTCP